MLASRIYKKRETELQFTRRLLMENPRGIKGLAYVLTEIRLAIEQGIIKSKIQKDNNGKGIGKFADVFNK